MNIILFCMLIKQIERRVLILRVFISHASKNKEIVVRFSRFLEDINSDIDVFCSSEKGSIKVGSDFVETIFKELNECDVFIPIISKEYYDSKFCMIELGVAYSYFRGKFQKNGESYIYPFALYPVQKGYALSGTPLSNLQTGDISDKEDLRGFLKYLSSEKGIIIGSGTNRIIHSFINEIDRITLQNHNILESARINTYFDDSIEYKHREDIAYYGISKDVIVVNYNMNPYEKANVKRPNFISLVLSYVDKLDLGRYLELNLNAEFRFVINSFTNSLNKIFVEFKYSNVHSVLEAFEFPVVYGENRFSIPLEKMKSNALHDISEICFVIHPDDVVEDEGMFKIETIKVE